VVPLDDPARGGARLAVRSDRGREETREAGRALRAADGDAGPRAAHMAMVDIAMRLRVSTIQKERQCRRIRSDLPPSEVLGLGFEFGRSDGFGRRSTMCCERPQHVMWRWRLRNVCV
jgi:hypothetical protein